jgi:protein-tyrosine-phosphatase
MIKALERVLFVCTGNTCRSVLAEHLGRRFCGDRFEFESAGIAPQRAADADNAIYTLRETFGIDASAHQPRNVRDVDLTVFELIIALDRDVLAILRKLGVDDEAIRLWAVRDPWGGDLTEYQRAALDVRRQLASLRPQGGNEA